MKSSDFKADHWIAVAFSRACYPEQFKEYDDETSEVYANFLDRPSSSSKYFVCPMSGKKMEEDKS